MRQSPFTKHPRKRNIVVFRKWFGIGIRFVLLLVMFSSCAVFKSAETRSALKIKREVERSPVFSSAFTGFTLLDPASGKTLVDVHGDHLFTPASNTKILTLATCLAVLGDSVPGIKMATQVNQGEKTGYFKPTCDPTFLHPLFQDWQPVLKVFQSLDGPNYLYMNGFKDTRFGPGWAWDDYNDSYSVERSAVPVFGNKMTILRQDSSWNILPKEINDAIFGIRDGALRSQEDSMLLREENSNIVHAPLVGNFTNGYVQEIPISNPDNYFSFFQDTLGNNIQAVDVSTKEEDREEDANLKGLRWQTIYSTPIDTVLRRMMYQSDNFIAEQMLLACAGAKFDYLKQDTIINWMLDSTLTTLPQRPRWVDGSGLSRYNLASPQDMAQVLLRLWETQPQARLFSLFPAGGVSGTLENWYPGKDGKPYVFAKTGSMSGVHCLSGYIVCNSGKVLIFSFMHNNFIGESKPWKLEMQRILEQVAKNS